MISEVRDLISLILKEDKYKKMVGTRYTGDIEIFRRAVSNTPEEAFKNRTFVHFTDTPKIGINPKSTYIKGYYFYPLTKTIFDGFVRDVSTMTRGQARGARYVYLVKINNSANILESDEIYESINERLRILTESIKESLLDVSSIGNNPGYAKIESELGVSLDSQAKELASNISDAINRLNPRKEESINNYTSEITNILEKAGAINILHNLLLSKSKTPTIEKNRLLKLAANLRVQKTPMVGITSLQALMSEKYTNTNRLLSKANSLSETFTKGKELVLDVVRHHINQILDIFASDSQIYVAKDGTIISGRDIGASALNRFLKETSIDEKTRKDNVGFFIKIAMGNEYDGVFDAGHKGASDLGGEMVKMGQISNQEKTQLYMRPEARKYFEIISMIDRFEGEKDWDGTAPEKFGHHTPDVGYSDDPRDTKIIPKRVASLKPRLKTSTGEPRERYK